MGKAKFAYTVWQWGVENKDQFHQALRDITEAGFDTFESVKAAINVYDHDSDEFMKVCKQYGVKPNGFYFHLTGDWDEDVGEFKRKLPFMAACDIHRLNFQGTNRRNKIELPPEDLEYTLKVLNAVGKLAHEYDILPCVHPHHNTSVMFEPEIDYIMQNTDPKYVGFGPDTAHLTAGQCDPVAVIKKYADRVAFTHLKDITGVNVESEGYAAGVEVYTNFRELGEGIVDFPGVFKVLDSVGYDGYLTAELDRSRTTNKISAANNLAFLRANYKQD